ncbi:MAG: carboxypeptidase-like regulatory domain-containing protein [Candidatus Sulfotelmatobacter sp.]
MRIGQRSTRLMILIVGFVAALGWSQTSTTSLRGTIVDPKGAVVPGAEVTLADPSIGFARTIKTNDQGFYQFLEVLPANYTLTIKAAGFSTLRIDNVRLLVNTPATLNQALRVQTVSESVEVMSQAPLVNTQDATIGHAFTTDQMTTLPLEGRDPVSILSLQPGVLYTGNSQDINRDSDSRSGAVSGARSDQTDITVDGLDDNDPVLGYAFQGALRSTLDSLEEFRVTTTNSNAEAGRSSGAQVSLVTKSGTNQFHGSLYEYNRSKIGEANSWFNERGELLAGQPNVPPHLVRNTFGTSIGGPIIKNRLFFFATYEGQRTHETSIVTRLVPTASLRKGILTYQCDNNGQNATCPTSGLFTLTPNTSTDLKFLDPLCSGLGSCPQGPGVDPAALAVFQSYPLPNNPTGGGDGYNISGYTFADPTPTKLDTYIVKLDYNLTANGNHRLFLRGNLQNDHQIADGAEFPGQPPNTVETNNGKGIAVGYTSVIRNSLINNFRYGFIREGLGQAGLEKQAYIFFYGLGISNPVGETPTTNVIEPLHNFVDDISWTKGKHTLQFGTNLRIVNNLRQSNAQSFNTATSNPTWLQAGGIATTGTSLDPGAQQFASLGFPEVSGSFTAAYDEAVSAVTGIVPEVTASYQETKNFTLLPEGAMVPRHFRSHEAELYMQDAWRVKPNLTLTFGLRYSLLQPPYETTGTQVAPSPGVSQWFRNRYIGMANGQSIQPLLTFSPSGQANGKPPIWNWDYHDAAPRFAFAWSPDFPKTSWLGKMFGESGKSSIRGGYGIYFDHFGEGVINSFDRMGSFGLTTIIGDPAGLVTPDQSPRFTSLYDIPSVFFGCGSPPCQLLPPAPTGGFPYAPPSTLATGGAAISWGLDNGLKTPYSHVVDFSLTRDLGHGFALETSYVGRFAHRLLQQRDVAQPMNLRDPKSGMDLYTATKMIAAAVQAGVPVQNLNKIPYFENLFPLNAHMPVPVNPNCVPAGSVAPANPTATQNMYEILSCNGGIDMTTELLQVDWDSFCDPTGATFPACATVNGVTKPYQFWDPQWSSLYVWSSVGNSAYNALQTSLRRRMSGGLQFDFNYTYSKSIDLGSDAERVNQYEGGSGNVGGGFASYIMNTWSPNQNRAVSDFDATHQFNANWMYQLPVGKGKHYAPRGALDAIFGNWELTGIFRLTSGFPTTVNDGNYWPTNWENTSNAILAGSQPKSGTFMVNGSPNIFQNPCCDPNSAINQFRFALPGEGGQRNLIRGAGYFGIDMGLGKTWNISESSALRFSWETFNITNSVRFDAAALEPFAGSNAEGNLSLTNSTGFGYYTSTLTNPRVMQFALRYSF